ncbi:sterol carrier family protein, partial [Leucobacter sp. M11]|uniref:sterol carrier family protein n=1 Tax=Leucobacter sp. M11 TaxID=2993565 RepID=UPI002D7F7F9B
VRYLLQELADRFPGGTLEVRVPPFGAVQCVEGPAHTRGTPPNVVEMAPAVWLGLATGRVSWAEARSGALVSASGTRATLEGMIPVLRTGPDAH